MDTGRTLNSRDSFPRRKFKNRAPTRCSPCPILWPPTISFELHTKPAEEIDLEKCTFRNFGSSVTLTLDRVEVTRCTHAVEVYPHTTLDGNRKNFLWMYRWTDTPEFQSTRSSPGNDQKITLRKFFVSRASLFCCPVRHTTSYCANFVS